LSTLGKRFGRRSPSDTETSLRAIDSTICRSEMLLDVDTGNVGVRRRLQAHLTQFLHNSQRHLLVYVGMFFGTLRSQHSVDPQIAWVRRPLSPWNLSVLVPLAASRQGRGHARIRARRICRMLGVRYHGRLGQLPYRAPEYSIRWQGIAITLVLVSLRFVAITSSFTTSHLTIVPRR
jgi:hypothetical protein